LGACRTTGKEVTLKNVLLSILVLLSPSVAMAGGEFTHVDSGGFRIVVGVVVMLIVAGLCAASVFTPSSNEDEREQT
jgi:hypothetical protein